MSTSTRRTDRVSIATWGYPPPGKHYARPQEWFALQWVADMLEAARGEPLERGDVDLCTRDLQKLGKALRRIAAGEDARHVFRQVRRRGKQDDRIRNQTVAWLYLLTLAQQLADGAPERTAVARATARARRQFPDKKIDAATVRRYAREFRDGILTTLQHMERTGTGPATAPLLAHLAKHGEHMSDGPDLPPLTTVRRPTRGLK